MVTTVTVCVACIWIIVAASIGFTATRHPLWKYVMEVTASICLVVGGGSFFASFLSCMGVFDELPSTFEWPVGWATGVVSTKDGLYVVPHDPYGRVQVYDRNWEFVRGWPVDADGGAFKVRITEENQIEVISARGSWRYLFTTGGHLLSKRTYEPATYDSFPTRGNDLFVPTPPWLLVFSHPLISGAVAACGVAMLIITGRVPLRRNCA